MVDAKAQVAAVPQQAPPPQPASPQPTPPQPAAPLQPSLVAQVQAPPPASAVPTPVPVAASIAAPQLVPSRLPVASGPVASVRPPQLARRPVAVPPQVLTPVLSRREPGGSRDANRWYRQGRYLTEQENFEEAVQALTQAIQMDPTLALALNARGYAHLRLRRYQDAINDCSQAIRLNPAYANAYLNRSVAKRAMGDIAGAREDQRHAAELDGSAQAQASLAKPASRP